MSTKIKCGCSEIVRRAVAAGGALGRFNVYFFDRLAAQEFVAWLRGNNKDCSEPQIAYGGTRFAVSVYLEL